MVEMYWVIWKQIIIIMLRLIQLKKLYHKVETTINNTKISNGMDTVNIDIKKIEGDYMNYRENGPEKVYQENPQIIIAK